MLDYEMATVRNVLELATGQLMPIVGLGTWLSSPEDTRKAVQWALGFGYRLIDTAYIYNNEEAVGEAVSEFCAANNIDREKIFITTKLWCSHNHPDYIEEQIKKSLANLKMDYIDLYLIHMPATFDRDGKTFLPDVKVEDIWRGMEKMFDKGYAKAIGVSNFTLEQIKRVQAIARIPIHNVQNECHLYLPQDEILDYCKKNNIVFTSYASIGSGGRFALSRAGIKVDWPKPPIMMDEPDVKKLASKHLKTPAQILLRYMMQRGIAVIPKSTNENRIAENFDVFNFELSAEDMKLLAGIKTRARLFFQDFLIGHPEYPFKGETHPVLEKVL